MLKAWRKKTTKSFSVRCEKPFKVLSHALKTAKAVLSWHGIAVTEGFFGAPTHFTHPLSRVDVGIAPYNSPTFVTAL